MNKNINYTRNQHIRIIRKWLDNSKNPFSNMIIAERMKALHRSWFSLGRRENEQAVSC
jgi:hypothetical protein